MTLCINKKIRKPLVLLRFLGMQKWNIALKWAQTFRDCHMAKQMSFIIPKKLNFLFFRELQICLHLLNKSLSEKLDF